MIRAACLLAIVVIAALVYAPSAGYGLFADDFQWLAGAQAFDASQLLSIEGREHFFRPVMEIYFPATYAVCGRAASCYHWLNIAVHAGTSLLVAGLAGALARSWIIGALAALLFAVQPSPTEAVVWISAITELLSAFFVVLTLWLLHRGSMWSALLAFVAAMMSHETGIVALPLAALMLWLIPRDAGVPPLARARRLVPLALAAIMYLPIVFIVNARNYVFTEGHYAIGMHIGRNIGQAIADFAAAGDAPGGPALLTLIVIAAAAGGTPRMKLYALWIFVALLPFAGFRDGMAPRYAYLAAVGFAGLIAETLMAALPIAKRSPRAGTAVWGVVVLLIAARSAVFTSKNVRPWTNAARPYVEYAAAMRAANPAPPPGSTLDAPWPAAFPPHFVPALLQWEYGDPALRARVPGID